MDMKKWLIVVAALVLLTGCGQAAPAEPTVDVSEAPVSPGASDTVIAEAEIEPARWVELRYDAGGTIVDVLVEEGDTVAEDDLLVALDPTDAQLALQQAQAALASAQAQLDRVEASSRAEEIAVAEAALDAAEATLSQAVARRTQLTSGSTEADVAAAQAQVASAQSQQLQAEELHEDTMECFTFKLPDGTKQEFCPALGDFEQLARAQRDAANDALAAAEAQLQAAEGGAQAELRAATASVASAVAQRDAAQAQLELARAGATAEQRDAAQASVEQAQVALAAAQAQLDRTQLHAPFAGTVVDVSVDPGDTAEPGAVVVVLATLDELQARTTDLTELDVARVALDQVVDVTIDALPEVNLRGHVARIGEQSVDYRGDVTYPVTVGLDETHPGLRWGMTALVEIETE